MSELLKKVIEEILSYCQRKKINAEKMDFLLIVDDAKKIRIKNTFDAAAKMKELMTIEKTHSSLIIFDKKEEYPILEVRFGEDGAWHLKSWVKNK